jgi:hypothetical protein
VRCGVLEGYDGLVRRLVRCLGESGLDYAFTGALAVSYYGSPRTTSDVDVMLAFGGEGDKLGVVNALRCAGLEVDEGRIDDALTSGYNIASFDDGASPYSVDVIFSPDRLEKRPGNVVGVDTFLQRPEGLILAKLRMIKATLSRERVVKDEEDVKSILTFTEVDLDVVRMKAERDGTRDILDYLLQSNGL